MITEFMEVYVAQGLIWCLLGAWRALPLFAIVFAIDLLTRYRIAARFHCLMWALVLIRMACPVSAPSAVSMHGYVDAAAEWALTEPATVAVPDVPFDTFTFEDANGESKTVAYFPGATKEEQAEADAYVAAQPINYVSAGDQYNQMSHDNATVDWEIIVSYSILLTWLLVAVGLLLRGGVQYLRFALRIRQCPKVTEQDHIDQVLRVCDALGCRRRPELKEVDGLTVPAVFGLFRHTICLPPGSLQELTSAELRMVLRHEIAHITRRDSLLLSLALLIRACHWFNPLAWLAVARLRNHMEQAADDRATRAETQQSLTDYGRLLLKYAAGGENAPQPATMGLLFVSGKSRLKQRIDMLDKNVQRNRATASGVAAAALVVLAATGLTDARTPEPEAAADFQPWLATSPQSHAGAIGLAEPGMNEEPKTEITYDVQASLVKLKETLGASEKAAEFYITSLLQHPLSADAASIEDGRLTVTQTAEGYRSTASLMHAWERSGAWQISLECMLLEAELSAASDFDWAIPGDATEPGGQPDDSIPFATQGSPPLELPITPPSGSTPSVAMETSEVNVYSSPVVATRISRFQKRLLLSRVKKNTRSKLMFAPNITLCNGQRASVSDEIHRPFVTGVRKVANPTAQFKPIIQTVSEGWCLHLHSEVTEEQDVDLQCVITESKLLDVEFAHLPYSSKDDLNPDVTVQVPNVRRMSLTSSVRLAAGESLLIASPVTFKRDAPEQESMARFYLVTPTLISEREVLDIATE